MNGRSRILVLQHEEEDSPGQLRAAASESDLELTVLMVRDTGVPASLSDEAGLVVLGGSMGVGDSWQYPHLDEEMELIRSAVHDDRPFLGICLGAQLAARALGGRVRRGEHGVEVGWVHIRPTAVGRLDSVTGIIGAGAELFQWHRDAFDVPPGGELLLTADRYPAQGFRYRNAWAIQSHPEVDPAGIASWCDAAYGSDDLQAEQTTRERLLEDAERKTLASRHILDAWCRVVRDC